ncbi:MAG TPA: DNA topoisomerase IB [Isosphaeraceae bacterium]|jgi:DNA topoisomerase-1
MGQTRTKAKTPTLPVGPITDPVASAQAVGLRYVNDSEPGLRRLRSGKGFRYVDAEGQPVRDPETLRRIKALTIPPAWTEVWICPSPRGHLQATGRDEKGRKQYRYHALWRAVRDETKYSRMIAFGRALGPLRAQVDRDLALPGLPRRKVLAAVVRLLETTLIRVGNSEYARTNRSYGLTTLRDRHVAISGGSLRFSFRGKSGVRHAIDLEDPRLARVVKRCRDLPGQELFQYLDDDGQRRDVTSDDVNAYLREVAGEEFTAKDFRTWAGTVLASLALQEFEAFDSQTQAKKNLVRAIETVAQRLGNTPTICRKCYVHPAVIDAYLEGTLIATIQQRAEQEMAEAIADLKPEEAAVLALLQQRLARERERDQAAATA